MKKLSIIFFMVVMGMATSQLWAQDFDYHLEESPAISWNGVPMFDARMMASAGISLMASAPFAAVINPALIASEGKFLLGFSYDKLKHEAFQYWGVNQGVIINEKPIWDNYSDFSGFAGAFKVKGIRFAAGWYLSNLLRFPSFKYEEQYQYDQNYYYQGLFSGTENTYFAAAAFKWGKAVDLGIKLDVISGKRDVTVTDFFYGYIYDDRNDTWYRRTIILEQQENHEFTLLVPTAGVCLQLSSHWMVGTALVYPLKGTVKRTLIRLWQNAQDNIDIGQIQHSSDTLYRPAKIYLGTTWEIPLNRYSRALKRFILAAETKYTLWSGYKYIFFNEEMPRDMKNTMTLGLALEYGSLSSKGDFFLRMGFSLDPQPVKEPGTTLKVLTGGIGTRFGPIAGDIGLAYFYGAPGGINLDHIILNGTLSIKL
ncbi:MAG: hypothetical protein JSV88_28730 [Candidatus Aminicenantes bacterium]|nr:MAG: hypothetical protein JSV88_28730 [Candidatus Aminicenantes bacterium]